MDEPRLQKHVELAASPEQVWTAVATGPGISAWFVPHEVEPREGGRVRQQFGGGFDTEGRVDAWEPGRRFAYSGPGGGRSHAFEFLVEGRDGGGTVLRFVQSGFSGEGWEDEYDSLDTGWNLFFANLAAYLEHFPGRAATTVVSAAFVPGSAADAWPVLLAGLGLTRRPRLGETATFAPAGPEPVTGVVDVDTPEFLGLRSATGLHRIGAEGKAGCGISAYHYFYRAGIDGPAATAAWQGWLAGLVPSPAC